MSFAPDTPGSSPLQVPLAAISTVRVKSSGGRVSGSVAAFLSPARRVKTPGRKKTPSKARSMCLDSMCIITFADYFCVLQFAGDHQDCVALSQALPKSAKMSLEMRRADGCLNEEASLESTENVHSRWCVEASKHCPKVRISEINKHFAACPSYPRIVVVPSSISDAQLLASSAFRSRGRFPVMSYFSKPSGGSLWRAGQPLPGTVDFLCFCSYR